MNTSITFEKLSAAEAKWYGAMEECYIVRGEVYGLRKKLAAIKDRKYVDNPKTGYIHGNGNLGTVAILLKDISILNA